MCASAEIQFSASISSFHQCCRTKASWRGCSALAELSYNVRCIGVAAAVTDLRNAELAECTTGQHGLCRFDTRQHQGPGHRHAERCEMSMEASNRHAKIRCDVDLRDAWLAVPVLNAVQDSLCRLRRLGRARFMTPIERAPSERTEFAGYSLRCCG